MQRRVIQSIENKNVMPAYVKMKIIMWLRKKFRDCAERSCVIAWMDKHAYDCVKIDKKMIVWMDTSLFSISDYVSPSPMSCFFGVFFQTILQLGGHEWRPWRMARITKPVNRLHWYFWEIECFLSSIEFSTMKYYLLPWPLASSNDPIQKYCHWFCQIFP